MRMAGYSTHIRRVDDHGGLGLNPIYRITVRDNLKKVLRPHARVVAIRELPAARVVDIETDTHRFYLPESDVIVHNCDDSTSLLAALCMSIGYRVQSRVVHLKGQPTYGHIFLRVQMPNDEWVPLDASVNARAGWEIPERHYASPARDFEVKG